MVIRPAITPVAWPHATPGEMLDKAQRDLDRLIAAERAVSRDDATDCALNACVAAWHVADMVHARVPGVIADRGDFNTNLRARSQAINLCQDIAEFYKHTELTRRRPATVIGAGVSAPIAHAVTLLPPVFTLGDGGEVPPPEAIEAEEPDTRTLSVKIRLVDGSKLAATDVVRTAIADWRRLLATPGSLARAP